MSYVTVTSAVADHTFTWRKQTAGIERFAEVTLGLAPLPAGSGITLHLDRGAELPEEIRRGALDGILDGLTDVFDLFEPSRQILAEHRPLALTDVEITGRVPQWHPTDTTPDVVRMVAASCVREIVWRAGGPQLLGS